jgi:3-dehydroquinate synthase
LFEYLELNYQEALNLNLSVLEKMVERSVTIKAQVVEQDEKENGVRRILNFGHTFAHGIEQSIGLPHGLAVSVGMVLAAKMSALLAGLDSAEVKRIMQLLQFMQLPVVADVPLKSLLASLRKDKKKQGQEIHFVLLQAMGQPCVKKLTFTQLEQIFHDLH